jgi:hypothetical protein
MPGTRIPSLCPISGVNGAPPKNKHQAAVLKNNRFQDRRFQRTGARSNGIILKIPVSFPAVFKNSNYLLTSWVIML